MRQLKRRHCTAVFICSIAVLTFRPIASGQTKASSSRVQNQNWFQKSVSPPKKVITARSGIKMAVTYGPQKQVCKIEIPPGVATSKQVHQAFEEAVPPSVRGKKWNELMEYDGLVGDKNTYYEHVIVSEELFTTHSPNDKPEADVVFKDKACGWQPVNDSFDTPPTAKPRSTQK